MVCKIFLWLTQKTAESISHLAECLPKYLIKTYMRERIDKAKEFTKLKCVSEQWHDTCLEILYKMRLSPTPVSSTKNSHTTSWDSLNFDGNVYQI